MKVNPDQVAQLLEAWFVSQVLSVVLGLWLYDAGCIGVDWLARRLARWTLSWPCSRRWVAEWRAKREMERSEK